MSTKRSSRTGGRRSRGVVIALDYGTARVGVAVSDELGLLAHPRPALDARDPKALARAVVDVVRDEEATHVLVGLPIEMAGGTGPSAERAMEFATLVANATGLEVELVDERLTTAEAERRLREAGRKRKDTRATIDGAAACVLLQAWLDRPGGRLP